MSKKALVLLLAFGLMSEASASILPVKKGKGQNGFRQNSLFKKNKPPKDEIVTFGFSANQLGSASDSLKSKRITAAILAVPLGMLGVHRMYLGTKPHIPIIYIATIGGCFGILPFIDFVVLLLSDDATPFINNPRVFMWNKPKKDN